MPNRALRKTLLTASVALLPLLPAATAPRSLAQQAQQLPFAAAAAAASPSDEQVVKDLTARNEKKASAAVREVMLRGGRMIPHLLKFKGDHRCFFGDMELGSHAGCSIRLMPVKGVGCFEEHYSSTLEVAALFLIESVYRNDLEFAQGATLIERDTDGQQRLDVKYNGREVIARAWGATELWFKEFEREGLEALRARDRGPFGETKLGFY
jgi:hypothetical protein